jgi:hypothetical protein
MSSKLKQTKPSDEDMLRHWKPVPASALLKLKNLKEDI